MCKCTRLAGTLVTLPNRYTMFDIAQMVYQHEIEEKGVLKWCTILTLQTFEIVSKLLPLSLV